MDAIVSHNNNSKRKSKDKKVEEKTDQNISYRNIISKLSKSDLNINKNIEWLKDIDCNTGEKTNSGWIQFSVDVINFGFTSDEIRFVYNKEIFSNFIIDFLGEFLVRTNINLFLTEVLSINEEEYLYLASKEKHKRFGAKINENYSRLTLTFHVSLLQHILTEDFKFHISY